MHPYAVWQGGDSKWRTYIPDSTKESGRKLIKRIDKKSVEDDIVAHWQSEVESPILKDIFYEWLDERLELHEISKGTYDRYENDFKRYYMDDRHFGAKRIKDITENDVEYFIRMSVAKHNLSSKGFANLKLVTKGLFKRAKKKNCITWSISQLIKDMEISKNTLRKVIKEDFEEVFNEEETQKMMNYLHDNLDLYNLAIILLFVTGLRIGELAALKWDDFNGIGFTIKRTEIRYKSEEKGKTIIEVRDFPKTEAGYRTAIIPTDYLWIIRKLRAMNPFGEYIFVKNGERVRTYMISERLGVICKNLKIYHKSPHKIRKTYGTILLDNKVDNNLIMQQMGHVDIATTEIHYHRNRKNLEKKADIISALPEFSNDNKILLTTK